SENDSQITVGQTVFRVQFDSLESFCLRLLQISGLEEVGSQFHMLRSFRGSVRLQNGWAGPWLFLRRDRPEIGLCRFTLRIQLEGLERSFFGAGEIVALLEDPGQFNESRSIVAVQLDRPARCLGSSLKIAAVCESHC